MPLVCVVCSPLLVGKEGRRAGVGLEGKKTLGVLEWDVRVLARRRDVIGVVRVRVLRIESRGERAVRRRDIFGFGARLMKVWWF